jgi:hypothetical protein
MLHHLCHLLGVGFYLVHRSLAECNTMPSKLAREVLSYLCHGDWLHGEKVRIARTFHLHNTNTVLAMIEDQLVLRGDEAVTCLCILGRALQTTAAHQLRKS